VVEVVREPDADAAARGSDDRGADDLGRLVAETQVVEREIERLPRLAEERSRFVRDLERRLAAVGERPELEGRYCCALIRAL
jgi:hypothetical protein